MAQFKKKVPKHPTDCDQSLRAVLDNIKFNNENDAKLVDYTIKPKEIELNYEDKP